MPLESFNESQQARNELKIGEQELKRIEDELEQARNKLRTRQEELDRGRTELDQAANKQRIGQEEMENQKIQRDQLVRDETRVRKLKATFLNQTVALTKQKTCLRNTKKKSINLWKTLRMSKLPSTYSPNPNTTPFSP